MKTERTPTRAFRVQSTLTSQSPEADRSRMALDQRDSSSGALDLERALLGSWKPHRMSMWALLAALPGSARNAHSPDVERRRDHFSMFPTCTPAGIRRRG